MILLMIALFGLCIPNGLFVYYLATEFSQWNDIFTNHLALAFITDAFMVTILGSYYFAVRPIGQVKWHWFLLLSLIGGLGVNLPLYWWLNQIYFRHD